MNQGLSEETIAEAKRQFWSRFDEFMSLIQKARGVEILLRIVTELAATYDFFFDKDFEKFRESNYAHNTKQYQKLIKEFMPSHEDQIQKVRLIGDAVAHLDLVTARAKLVEYGEKYPLACEINSDPVGIVRMNNIICEDGVKRNLGYKITSSEDNLFTEEMDVFRSQGCYKAADALFDEIRALIEAEAGEIELIDLSIRSQRGLKFGKPI